MGAGDGVEASMGCLSGQVLLKFYYAYKTMGHLVKTQIQIQEVQVGFEILH